MRKYLQTTGAILFILGIGAGDSECLLFPIGLMVLGYILYKLGGQHEKDTH